MRRGLGKGLEELLAIYDREDTSTSEKVSEVNTISRPISSNMDVKGDVNKININEIYPNPNQPRKTFDQESLQELANSIRVHGLIQPIIVNEMPDGYMIIAGERRFRASKICGLKENIMVL